MNLLHCMIVEDNPLNWMIMQNQMHKLGLHPVIFHDGLAALEYCRNHPLPHLILLDGYMPRMDGIAFLKELRKLPTGDKPYVLFCSASPDKINIEEAMQEGADCHFAKPLTQDQITFALRETKARFDNLTAYKLA